MLPRQEWCTYCQCWPYHDVVENNGEVMKLRCRKCGNKITQATETYLESLESVED